MATTDINGMVFFAPTDQVTPLQTNLNAISTAVTNAFNSETRTFRVANQAARDALLTARGASTSSPLQVDRADTGNIERNTTGLIGGWTITEGTPPGIALPAQTGWGFIGAPFADGSFAKDAQGFVTIQGTISLTGATLSSVATTGAMAVLPVGYRPSSIVMFNQGGAFGSNTAFRVNVDANGALIAQLWSSINTNWPTGGYISLSGIKYKV